MPVIPKRNKLADTRNVVVILRLVLSRRGRITHGEVVDMDGQAIGRFTGWVGMTRALRAWLKGQKPDHTRDDPASL